MSISVPQVCMLACWHNPSDRTVLLPEYRRVFVSLPYTCLVSGEKSMTSIAQVAALASTADDRPDARSVGRVGRPQWVSSQPPPRSPRVWGGGRGPTWRAPKGSTSPSPSPGPFTASGGPMRDSYPEHSTHGCSPCTAGPAPRPQAGDWRRAAADLLQLLQRMPANAGLVLW